MSKITRTVTKKRSGEQFKVGDAVIYVELVSGSVAKIIIEAPKNVPINFSLPKREACNAESSQ